MEEVKNTSQSKNFYLFVLDLLKTHSPTQICNKLNISKQRLNYYLSSLKKQNLIKKIGYGIWIVNETNKKEVKKHLMDRSGHFATSKNLKSDQVRGHAFQFTIQVPKNLRNWTRRRELLRERCLDFKELDNLFGGGEILEFKGRKIMLTPKSVVIYEKSNFIAETSHEARSYAINEMLELIKSFEKHLRADFSFGGRYKFKISRQHYALIKNALAKQYNKEGKKLEVHEGNDLWFLIDNSFNLHEAETVHPKTAVTDNKKVQDFFNGIKAFDNYTPKFVVNSLSKQAENIDHYAIHMKSHVSAVQDLAKGVNELRKEIKKLSTHTK